ncbi:hypothetical protein EZV62_027374 [Acer yangbiense]|uniref:Uncharacterized protein n=1 Tax=Acer yangbiense TaxID=1000413 RepID=A0A5C7GU32_9ROSI|nr:hypothetical protein EZV62_027374 [Acer yangbiense]
MIEKVCSRFIYNRNYVAKDINFGVGAQAAMLEGVSEVAEAVKTTMGLGSKGRNVIVEKSMGNPKVSKDGVTVTNKVAGDGNTHRTLQVHNMAVDAVISDLKRRARTISTLEEITQVATIFANGEHEIGELIARAMERVGKEGIIIVSDGSTLDNELEVVEGKGMKLARGYISPYFITDKKTQKCTCIFTSLNFPSNKSVETIKSSDLDVLQELQNPLILIYGMEISNVFSILDMFALVEREKREVLVVAEDVGSHAALNLFFLSRNLGGSKQVCAIKAPGFGENRRANLEDLAILTGGEVIYKDPNRGNVNMEMFGTAKKVIVSIDDTIILHGGGDKKLIEERCEQLRTTMEKSDTMFEREKAQERLSNLYDIAVLKVGGASKAEVGERKDMVEDALNATRAAVEEGIVPGGGVALLYATKALENLQTQNNDQSRGIQVIQNAIKATTLTIASNAGFDGSLVINKLLEQDDCNLVIDAAKGTYVPCEFVDMMKTGIIEPVKFERTALVEAARSSDLLLPTTTEAAADYWHRSYEDLEFQSNPPPLCRGKREGLEKEKGIGGKEEIERCDFGRVEKEKGIGGKEEIEQCDFGGFGV